MPVVLLSNSGSKVTAIDAGTAPITNPLGEPPAPGGLSPLAAATAASGSGSDPLKNILGVDTGDPSVKNLIFIGLLVWAYFKFGRKK